MEEKKKRYQADRLINILNAQGTEANPCALEGIQTVNVWEILPANQVKRK